MITVKPRRFNIERMRRHRERKPGMRRYQTWRFDRDAILDLPKEVLAAERERLLEEFAVALRRWHMWSGRVYKIDLFDLYDIDFNIHKWVFEEHPIPYAWRPQYTFLTVSKYGIFPPYNVREVTK